MKIYDVIVIGGGPGGYLSAELIGKAGQSCLLFEKRSIGGVCLNEGCIPTKSLLHTAKIFKHAAGKDFLQANAVARKNTSVTTLVKGVESALKKSRVTVVNGEASIKGKDTDGYIVACGENSYKGKSLILATGSEPVVPPVKAINELLRSGTVLTSREVLELEEVPENLVIIGAGVIGLEMAAYYSMAGSKVTIIEMKNWIGGTLDREISSILKKELEDKGVIFHLSARVKELTGSDVIFEADGISEKTAYSKVLLSTGRKPVIVEGLSTIGVKTGKSGIEIDDFCRTNVSGVYAVGDVSGKIMLAHVAYRQAEAAVNDILGIKDYVEYHSVPSVIYTQPEVGWAGLSEDEAVSGGYDIEIRKATINLSGRHVVENGISSGICKIIIDKKKGIIIGGGLVGSYASEIIYALVLMIQNRIPVASIRKTIFPHPTVCEVIKEALR